MEFLTDKRVASELKEFGTYRVGRTFALAEREYDAVCWLALGLRETHLDNIEGGAVWGVKRDGEPGWVFPTDPADMDVGPYQISRKHQKGPLLAMTPAVKVGTWQPYYYDHTAYEKGYAPRFEESINFMRKEFYDYRAYALARGVPSTRTFNFCICAHNAGAGGAMKGWNAGGMLADFDTPTAGGDYVSWVRHTMIQVDDWLGAHPNWKTPQYPA